MRAGEFATQSPIDCTTTFSQHAGRDALISEKAALVGLPISPPHSQSRLPAWSLVIKPCPRRGAGTASNRRNSYLTLALSVGEGDKPGCKPYGQVVGYPNCRSIVAVSSFC